MRRIDEGAIKAHADLRFRSEYDYALFEYFRSAKVFAFLDQSGVRLEGRVLDMGCGGGGMPLSFAEETAEVVAILGLGGVGQFVQFAAGRSYANVEASRELGRRLPAGTLVHGKLANGLALENRIRPIFVGRNFGNYADRLTRNDVPWLLTYVAPRTGYEGPVILDVLAAYPEHRTVWTFDVAETTSGQDRAALIAKGPPAAPATPVVVNQAP